MSASQYPKPPFPAQTQAMPGATNKMDPRPDHGETSYKGSGKLQGKVALITGGDSGIGRAVAIAFAKEGADIAIIYLKNHKDAEETKKRVEEESRRCVTLSGDVGDKGFCREAVKQVVGEFSHLDILVNNAAEQHPQERIAQTSAKQLERTFRTNIFSMF